jgi:hypothetical protein
MQNKSIPLIWGIIFVVAAVAVFFLVDSTWIKVPLATVLFFAGWTSIKAGAALSNSEVGEVISGNQSKKTKDKLSNL